MYQITSMSADPAVLSDKLCRLFIISCSVNIILFTSHEVYNRDFKIRYYGLRTAVGRVFFSG